MNPVTRAAVIAGFVRTPIGRYGGALASVRPDSLMAHAIGALLERTHVDPEEVDDVIVGCTNQAGEDNRNVARMAALLAGLPVTVPGQTVNRLCGSGLQAVNAAAQAIWSGQGELFITGGVESMTRSPIVMLKPEAAYARGVPSMADSTLGWRFPHPDLDARGYTDSLGQTAENVAERRGVSRADQDAFALGSQHKTARAVEAGRLAREVVPTGGAAAERANPRSSIAMSIRVPRPRSSNWRSCARRSLAMARSPPATRRASTMAPPRCWSPRPSGRGHSGCSRWRSIVSTAVAGVAPDEMGLGPIPATRKALQRADLQIEQMQIVELNEAFASQVIACLDDLGVDWRDEERVNPNGGAIALGHPLGASGARLAGTSAPRASERDAEYALVTMCIGVGQGIATILQRAD